MHIPVAVLPIMHIHVCIKCASINCSTLKSAHTCMHQSCINYVYIKCSSLKYAHACMDQTCIKQSQCLQFRTYMYASIMHISTAAMSSMHMQWCIDYASIMYITIAVLASMHIRVCIKYAYINRSDFKYARTCMHQLCIKYAYTTRSSCKYAHARMHQVCIYQPQFTCAHIHVFINCASSMHISFAVPPIMRVQVCINCAYINRSDSTYALTCMHLVCIKYACINIMSLNYTHTCMHQVVIYQPQFLQLCTLVHASSMHLSVAVLQSCTYMYASSMHQLCIMYASCMPTTLLFNTALIYQAAPYQLRQYGLGCGISPRVRASTCIHTHIHTCRQAGRQADIHTYTQAGIYIQS